MQGVEAELLAPYVVRLHAVGRWGQTWDSGLRGHRKMLP